MSNLWSRGNKQGPLFFDGNFFPFTKTKFSIKLKFLLKLLVLMAILRYTAFI